MVRKSYQSVKRTRTTTIFSKRTKRKTELRPVCRHLTVPERFFRLSLTTPGVSSHSTSVLPYTFVGPEPGSLSMNNSPYTLFGVRTREDYRSLWTPFICLKEDPPLIDHGNFVDRVIPSRTPVEGRYKIS